MFFLEVFDEILVLKLIFCNLGEFYFINLFCLEVFEGLCGLVFFKICVKCIVDELLKDVMKLLEKIFFLFVVEVMIVFLFDYL